MVRIGRGSGQGNEEGGVDRHVEIRRIRGRRESGIQASNWRTEGRFYSGNKSSLLLLKFVRLLLALVKASFSEATFRSEFHLEASA